MKKDELKRQVEGTFRQFGNNDLTPYELRVRILELIDQLDEPEVLSQEFINEKAVEVYADTADAEVHVVFRMRDLQNLLVPTLSEMETVEITEEPETVADVIADFYKSCERLQGVMSMEVEELEE